MQRRYQAVLKEAARRMQRGEVVFCPIAHSHSIGKVIGVSTDHHFWMKQDIPLLVHSTKVVVYCLAGWDASRGVTEEVHIANRLGIPVEFYHPYPYDEVAI
jgi:hypothetical protein